ncbi:MAG TPA: hypothetical protein VL737_03565 [Candidatus Pristimantibacillus sp.]|nr:hypothetical protein [Candidatus Pristimantibacillus sp.]
MIAKHYIELRKPTARGSESVIADAMRHLNTRQHLGRAVIVCPQPAIALSAARKQWLKLSRALQKQRSSTLNADKILKYTHTITRMQRMRFTAKTPLEQPDGEVYFLQPDELATLPVHCWTLYILSPVSQTAARLALAQLPPEALIVDYRESKLWDRLGVAPKKVLEARVKSRWQQADNFLRGHRINVSKLIAGGIYDAEAMDDALDTILGGHSHEFLQVANEFQRSLELARPLRLKKEVRFAYDSLILLAHRVQALRPDAYNQQFLESYNEDDTFFLYDTARLRKYFIGSETPAEVYDRHNSAGRYHLARSLQSLAEVEGVA